MNAIAMAVIDLTNDHTPSNAAKRPIELLSDSSDEERSLHAIPSRRKRFRHQTSNEHSMVVDHGSVLGEDTKLPAQSPLSQILEVFPDVCPKFAKTVLQQEGNNVTSVLHVLADSAPYPKAKGKTKHTKRKPDTLVPRRHEECTRKYRFDFMSADSFVPDTNYCAQARHLLLQDFRFIRANVISSLFIQSKNHYALCHDTVCRALMQRDEAFPPKDEELEWDQFTRLEDVLQNDKAVKLNKSQLKALSAVSRQHKRHISLLTRRPHQDVALSHKFLMEEVSYVQDKMKDLKSRMDSIRDRRQARLYAQATSSTIECDCCYTEVSPEEMVQCNLGHLFCGTCLRRMCDTHIFDNGNFGNHPITKDPATELLCMAGCGAGFSSESVSKWLPKQTLQKYHELQFQANVCKAHIDNLCSCPKCGFQAELPAAEMIFRCPVGECAFESCRRCGEEPHIPFSCEEIEKQTNARLKVEEAISLTKIRTCPKPGCRKKFVKEFGCNKMKCACGTLSCYNCRKLIPKQEGYKHFCQVPLCNHENCGKCVLYSKDEDDAKAMREAGIKAVEQILGEKLVGTDSATMINVDEILKMPDDLERMKTKRTHRGVQQNRILQGLELRRQRNQNQRR